MAKKIKGQKVIELASFEQKAHELEAAMEEARKAAQGARTKASERLRWLRQEINEGRSTGDHLLDLKIMVWGDAERDDIYNRLVAFSELLQDHAGELVAELRHNQEIESLSVLPHEPKLSFVLQPTLVGGIGYDKRHEAYLVLPVAIQARYSSLYEPAEIRLNGTFFERDDVLLDVVFEADAQKIFEGITNPNIAFSYWTNANQVGRPLSVFPLLAAEIQNRREAQIIDLHEAAEELRLRMRKLQELRNSPEMVFESNGWCRGDIKQTSEGFHVSLREVDEVALAALELQRELEAAELLQMQDNSTYQECVELKARYLSSVTEEPEETDPGEEIPF